MTLGKIETHGVSVYIPAQTFDNKTSVTLSHPDKNLLVDKSAFAPAGAPVQIESSGSQRRLNKPAKITMAVDNLRRGSSGVLYIAALNEQNEWDYIVPDEVDVENKRVTFRTHHLGTYGLVDLTEEKIVDEFTSRRSVKQWAQISLETDANWMRNELVKEILVERLKISDTSVLENLIVSVAQECSANKLVAAIVDRDVAKFIKSITESAAKQIPEYVELMIYVKDLVDLVYIRYDKGEEAYLQAIYQRGFTTKQVAGISSENVKIDVESPVAEQAADKGPDVQESVENEPEATEPETTQPVTSDTAVIKEADDSDLDGMWEEESGTIVRIKGDEGTFVSFSTSLQEFVDAGILSPGDILIKDIKQKNDSESGYKEWTCVFRVFFSLDPSDSYAMGWSDWAFILLSKKEDFFIITVTATDPKTGEVYIGRTFIYNRVSIKTGEDGEPANGPVPDE